MTSAAELRELEDDDLEERLAEYRRELLNLRFQLATGQLDNSTRMAVVRKDVARVLTILRDREIALAEGRFAGPVINDRPRPPRRRPVEEEDEVDEEILDDELAVGEEGEGDDDVVGADASDEDEEDK
jgi:large subunit ribosomal protein L29